MAVASATLLTGASRQAPQWPSVGTRVRQLAPVANRPLLLHAIDALDAAGVPRAQILVDAYSRDDVRTAVRTGAWRMELSCVDQDPWGGATPAALPSPAPEGAAILLQEADFILREDLRRLSDSFERQALDALALRVRDDGGRSRLAGCLVGVSALGLLATADLRPGLAHLLACLRERGARVAVRTVEGCLPSAGDEASLLEANRHVLEWLRPDRCHAASLVRSVIQGSVVIHPSAELRRTTVRGPAVIAAGVYASESYIGPFTSVAAGATLEGVEIDNSIVLEDAQLRFPGVRIENSVIGRGARVARDFRLPRAIRVSLGEAAEVMLP